VFGGHLCRVEALAGRVAGQPLERLRIGNPFVVRTIAPGPEELAGRTVLGFRRMVSRLIGRGDPRRLLSRPGLYELISEIGFVRVYAVYNDFVFAPLTRSLVWWLRNLSILLENAPLVSRMAGSILLRYSRVCRSSD